MLAVMLSPIFANGKAPKQAIIAITRKLLIILNAMIRENRPYHAG